MDAHPLAGTHAERGQTRSPAPSTVTSDRSNVWARFCAAVEAGGLFVPRFSERPDFDGPARGESRQPSRECDDRVEVIALDQVEGTKPAARYARGSLSSDQFALHESNGGRL